MANIDKVVKGSTPSLIQTEKANQLINALNGLLNMKAVEPVIVTVDDSFKVTLELDTASLTDSLDLETMQVTICVDGSPVTKNIYVQSDET
jgi:hypothetical protein